MKKEQLAQKILKIAESDRVAIGETNYKKYREKRRERLKKEITEILGENQKFNEEESS